MIKARTWGWALSRLAGVIVLVSIAPRAQAQPVVITTIKPVHAIVSSVMDGKGEPALLLDGATSPHDYAMKPSDIRRINSAQLVIRVSEALEPFLTKPLKLVPAGVRVLTLDAAAGVELLALRTGEAYEAHGHDHGGRHGHGHGHGHGKPTAAKAGASRTRPSEADPHVWLDPANARAIALAVAKALAEIDPSQAAHYDKNAQLFSDRLATLETSLAAELKPLAGQRYIVFHDAYQYLEHRFGLAGAGSVTLSPEVPPSAQRLSRIRARLAKDRIACVFAEPQFQPKAINTIIEGTRVRKGVLDPLGVDLAPGPEQYFAVMRGLARDLKECLSPAG